MKSFRSSKLDPY